MEELLVRVYVYDCSNFQVGLLNSLKMKKTLERIKPGKKYDKNYIFILFLGGFERFSGGKCACGHWSPRACLTVFWCSPWLNSTKLTNIARAINTRSLQGLYNKYIDVNARVSKDESKLGGSCAH
ncbi:hypothetical protein ACJX0J_022648, partial [Zea mays]